MSRILVILRLFWSADTRRFLAGLASAFATILAGIALLGLSGWFIAACALAGVTGIGLSFDFFRPSAAIRFLALLRTASRYGERLLTHEATLSFLVTLRCRLLGHFARTDYLRLGRLRSGELLARIISDIDNLDNVYLRLFLPVLSAVLAIATTAGALALFNPPLALLVGATFAAGLLIALVAGAMVGRRASRSAALAKEALRIRMLDLVRGQVELIFAGRMEAQRSAVLKADLAEQSAGSRANLAEMLSGSILLLTGQIALLLLLWSGANSVAEGALDLPRLALFLLAALALTEAIAPITRGICGIGRTALAARRILPAIASPTARPALRVAAAPVGGENDPRTTLLDLRGVGFAWKPGQRPVLSGVSLSLGPGERVALEGPSGAGKSTLLAIAAGLMPPTEGKVLLGGTDMAALDGATIRKRIGMLPHGSALFCDTIAANLRLAAPGASDAALWLALRATELEHHVRSLPEGLAFRLAERGGGLSGGQLRRLALARLFLREPKLFLLDEPTEGMDEALGLRVLANLFAARPDAAFLFSSHRVAERRLAARTIAIRPDSKLRLDADQYDKSLGSARN